jgi:hypothetical protein
MQRIFINKCFLFTVGSVLSRKEVEKVENFTHERSKVAYYARPYTEVVVAAVKILRGTCKAMGQVLDDMS